jgi:prepilin-type N-terminal cleavage/methylation domain-containing protein
MAQVNNFEKRGFSLIEIIVAIGVFSVVSTIAVGALLSLSSAQKKAFNIQTNQDNIRYALETMAREIRTGASYQGVADHSRIQFKNSRGQVVVYTLNGTNTIIKSVDAGVNFYPVTAPEVQVSNLYFYITGESTSDNYQPRVTITMRADTPGVGVLNSQLELQTTISQFLLDAQI